jgi:hypothetical protein
VLLELREPHVDRAGEFAGAAGQALIERIDVIAHRLGYILGALAQALHQFAAIGLHGAVELGDVTGDQAAERVGVARDLFAERGAALVEHVLEGLQARGQHVLDRVAAAVEHLRQGFGVLAEVVDHRVAGRTQRGVHFLGAGGDSFGHLAAGLGEGVVELLRAARHGLDGDGGFLREALRDLVEPGAHHLLQAGGEVGKLVVHVLGLEIEAVR